MSSLQKLNTEEAAWKEPFLCRREGGILGRNQDAMVHSPGAEPLGLSL